MFPFDFFPLDSFGVFMYDSSAYIVLKSENSVSDEKLCKMHPIVSSFMY